MSFLAFAIPIPSPVQLGVGSEHTAEWGLAAGQGEPTRHHHIIRISHCHRQNQLNPEDKRQEKIIEI